MLDLSRCAIRQARQRQQHEPRFAYVAAPAAFLSDTNHARLSSIQEYDAKAAVPRSGRAETHTVTAEECRDRGMNAYGRRFQSTRKVDCGAEGERMVGPACSSMSLSGGGAASVPLCACVVAAVPLSRSPSHFLFSLYLRRREHARGGLGAPLDGGA